MWGAVLSTNALFLAAVWSPKAEDDLGYRRDVTL
jgi:hypothetical protein